MSSCRDAIGSFASYHICLMLMLPFYLSSYWVAQNLAAWNIYKTSTRSWATDCPWRLCVQFCLCHARTASLQKLFYNMVHNENPVLSSQFHGLQNKLRDKCDNNALEKITDTSFLVQPVQLLLSVQSIQSLQSAQSIQSILSFQSVQSVSITEFNLSYASFLCFFSMRVFIAPWSSLSSPAKACLRCITATGHRHMGPTSLPS